MKLHTEILYEAYLGQADIVIDSRKVTPGCIFFGLEGQHVDGSTFAVHALEAGAALAVAKTGLHASRPGLILTDDPLLELQRLAMHRRKQLRIPVLAITGSNGKTTTKELIFRVLSMQYRTTATAGNFNNHIGVPLTLLAIRDTDEMAIVEMGANHVGEIAFLSSMAMPTHGLITNIGRAHLEGFGGIEGVVRGKTELYEFLAAHEGLAFVNLDEPYLPEHAMRVARRIGYHAAPAASFNTQEIGLVYHPGPEGGSVAFVDESGTHFLAQTGLFGAYNLKNVATAITVGLHFQIKGDVICDAIASYVPGNNRSQRVIKGSNVWILDAYNANPTSMLEAIRSFARLEHPKKGMILGAMMELGTYSEEAHAAMIEEAGKLGITELMLIGEAFRVPAQQRGYPWFATVRDIVHYWTTHQFPENMCFLVKGSRAMQLESMLDTFQ